MLGVTHAWDWTLWLEIGTAVLAALAVYILLARLR